MARIAVVAIIENGEQVLVGREIKTGHFMSDLWHIPGGRVKDGETEEQALIREMKEETGIDVKVVNFLDEFLNQESEVLKICDPKAVSLWPPKVVKYFKS